MICPCNNTFHLEGHGKSDGNVFSYDLSRNLPAISPDDLLQRFHVIIPSGSNRSQAKKLPIDGNRRSSMRNGVIYEHDDFPGNCYILAPKKNGGRFGFNQVPRSAVGKISRRLIQYGSGVVH
jgi:hypothetical protein